MNQYFKLCKGLGKNAHFLYDLDSLFSGNLRACIKDDETIQSFLASAGLGNDFRKYCGDMDRKLTCLIDQLLTVSLTGKLTRLGEFLKGLGNRKQWKKEQWSKARTAVMTAISRYREDVASVSEENVTDIEGRLRQIVTALKEKNIHLLPGGTIERYLPCYCGDDYKLAEDAKRRAIDSEIQALFAPMAEEKLSSRYDELYDAICDLPSKEDVDINPVLHHYLSDYIHKLQQTIINNPDWNQGQIQDRLNTLQPSLAGVFSIGKLERSQQDEFNATIEIAEMLGQGKRFTQVDHHTNAGMGEFKIESDHMISAGGR